MAAGTLYFIPVPLAEDTTPQQVLPAEVVQHMHKLRHFIVENEKTARQFLAASGHPVPIRELSLTVLTKDTPAKDLPKILQPLQQGTDVGLMSEAGRVVHPGEGLQVHARINNSDNHGYADGGGSGFSRDDDGAGLR